MNKLLLITLVMVIISSCNTKKNLPLIAVTKGTVSKTISIQGRVESSQQASLTAPYDASVKTLFVRQGQTVNANQELLQLDTKDLERQIRDKQSLLNQQKLAKNSTEIKIRKLNQDLKRMESAFRSQVVSKTDLEKVKTEIDLTNNETQSTLQKILDLQKEIDILNSQIRDAVLRAPIKGQVTNLWIPFDQFVSGTSVKLGTNLITISGSGNLSMTSQVRERDILAIYKGQNFKINMLSIGGVEFNGRVDYVDEVGTIDNNSGVVKYRVTLKFPPSNQQIKTGMEAIATASIAEKKNVLIAPLSSVKVIHNKYYVRVPSRKKYETQEIKLGLIGDDYVEIKEGLSENDIILAVYESADDL